MVTMDNSAVRRAHGFEASGGRRRQDRQRASQEAVNNRRENRRASTDFKKKRRLDAEARNRTIALRMTQRFFRGQQPGLIALDYRYWQARRCGWDVRSKELRTIGTNRDGSVILCDPEQTTTWKWWTRMHYEQREVIFGLSRIRLVSGA